MAEPLFAVAVMAVPAPTSTVATAKAFELVVPAICRMPSLVVVAPNATTSEVATVETDSSSVFTPGVIAASPALVHEKPRDTFVGLNVVADEKAMTKLCALFGGYRPENWRCRWARSWRNRWSDR